MYVYTQYIYIFNTFIIINNVLYYFYIFMLTFLYIPCRRADNLLPS